MTDPLEWVDPPVYNALPAVDNLPLASFPQPVPAPDCDPDDCENGDTICVRYRAEWYPLVAGAISQLLQPSTWLGTHDEVILALNRAELLKDMLRGGQTDVGNCGCVPTQYRYTADGLLEQSTDGGETWTDASAVDPRNTGTLFAPLPIEAGSVLRCTAADNIVINFIGLMDQSADNVDATSDLAEILVVLAGTVAIFSGIFSPFLVALVAFAAEGLAFGADAIRAAFDNDVWDRFRCNVYCHMNSEGVFTADSISGVLSQVDVDETGVANSLLKKAINVYGAAGMTNQGRTGGGAGTDCADCPCNCSVDSANFSGVFAPPAMPDNEVWFFDGCEFDTDEFTFGTSYSTNYLQFPAPRIVTRVSFNITDSYPASFFKVRVGDLEFTQPAAGNWQIDIDDGEIAERIEIKQGGAACGAIIDLMSYFYCDV